ncbi:MAG: helix-turn-helix domain-containing protein [Pseudomonadota bacterium]
MIAARDHLADIQIRSCFYAPGLSQPRHCDEKPRISVVVEGEFAEETNRFTGKISAGAVLMKSDHGAHSTRFGDTGAFIVSLIFSNQLFDEVVGPIEDGWRLIDKAPGVRLAARLLEAALSRNVRAVQTAAADAASVFTPIGGQSRKHPVWLSRVKDELADTGLRTFDVAAASRSAGVHPAHISRQFKRAYGETISDFARRNSVRRAMSALAREQTSLADAALAAGFYDQSHMNRAFRAVAGVTPMQWRRLSASFLKFP